MGDSGSWPIIFEPCYRWAMQKSWPPGSLQGARIPSGHVRGWLGKAAAAEGCAVRGPMDRPGVGLHSPSGEEVMGHLGPWVVDVQVKQ